MKLRFNRLLISLSCPFLLLFCFSTVRLQAQEVLDVLPLEGRNELFHSTLMDVVDSLSNLRKLDLEEAVPVDEFREADR
ncbi:MAG: hypothetical protein JXR52_12520 [Bacteroidales bacterium]|nr:hypothetical protein [Bacteroidales bacterium]MBN2699642.1 hypothetical protein [Bacteroidales bacterium]